MSRRSRRSPREVLEDAQAHFEVVASYATEDVKDQLTVDAICMRLSAGIEALSTLDDTAREAFFGKTWHQMWGMRNRIAHGYLLIDPATVHSTVERDLPIILDKIHNALEQLP